MITGPITSLTAPVTIADTATIRHQCVLGYPQGSPPAGVGNQPAHDSILEASLILLPAHTMSE